MDFCNDDIVRNLTLRAVGENVPSQNLEYIVHSLAREYGPECIETWNTVFADLYPQLASNWTHGGRNSSNGITPYTMGYGADFFWTAIFTVMLVVAICGNLVVFWIVIGHRRMQNVTNYFLVNLSCADLMMSCLNTAFNFTFMKSREWIFGEAYCTINNFIAYMSVSVSVFSLVAIAMDRYIAIVRPLKPRISKVCAFVLIIVIWVGSGLLAIPAVLYSKTWTFDYDVGVNVTVCFLLWPDGPPTVSTMDYIYNIIFFVVTYIIPIMCMGICYGRIGLVLWGQGPQDENASQDLALQRKLVAKRNVVKMFIVVVIIFCVCWLPYHAYFIYTYHDKEVVTEPYIQHVYLGFYFLAMANAMINPLIYYGMNARFRGYFQALMSSMRLLCCEPGRFLFKRSDSKSSLDIGVRPMDGGVVRMELHHYTNPVPARRTRRQPINAAANPTFNVQVADQNTPAVIGNDYTSNRSSGSAAPSRSRYKLSAHRTGNEMVGNDSLSNFHSEPALARRMVTFNETGQNQVLTAHSSGELNKQQIDKPRKKGGKSKVLKKPKCSPSHSHSGGGGESQQGLQQNGVLRISAPFLNNPAAQSVYLY